MRRRRRSPAAPRPSTARSPARSPSASTPSRLTGGDVPVPCKPRAPSARGSYAPSRAEIYDSPRYPAWALCPRPARPAMPRPPPTSHAFPASGAYCRRSPPAPRDGSLGVVLPACTLRQSSPYATARRRSPARPLAGRRRRGLRSAARSTGSPPAPGDASPAAPACRPDAGHPLPAAPRYLRSRQATRGPDHQYHRPRPRQLHGSARTGNVHPGGHRRQLRQRAEPVRTRSLHVASQPALRRRNAELRSAGVRGHSPRARCHQQRVHATPPPAANRFSVRMLPNSGAPQARHRSLRRARADRSASPSPATTPAWTAVQPTRPALYTVLATDSSTARPPLPASPSTCCAPALFRACPYPPPRRNR